MEKTKINTLQKTVEEQNKKIEKYKVKLTDLIQAYKDLQLEKNTLEETINALNSSKKTDDPKEEAIEVPQKKDVLETNEQNIKNLDNDKENDKTQTQTETDEMKNKIDVLTKSLMTLSQQKTKLETNWMSERKENINEVEKKEKEVESLLQQIQQLENDVSDWRGKLRTQQQEHEQQQKDCAIMIKELQNLLSAQKMINEKLSTQINEMKISYEEKEQFSSSQLSVALTKEKMLKEELKGVKSELEEILIKSKKRPKELEFVENKFKQWKESSLKKEEETEIKINDYEFKIKELTREYEEKNKGLEVKIFQLSGVIGELERASHSRKEEIISLKQRKEQLMEEIEVLSKLVKSPDLNSLLNNLTNDELETKVEMIINKLKTNNCDFKKIKKCLGKEAEEHNECREQLEELREEFEKYKLRAQSVLENKNKKPHLDNELMSFKSQLLEAKNKLSQFKNRFDDKEKELEEKEKSFSKILTCLDRKQKQELSAEKAEWRQKMIEVESEMKKQRERTISMLADKDQEITDLKERLDHINSKNLPLGSLRISSLDENQAGAASFEENDQNVSIKHLLNSRVENLMDLKSSHLLYYAEEKARLEVEKENLKKQKYFDESRIHEMQVALSLKEEEHLKEVNFLKEVIRKIERDSKRESANMEYLKNIVFQYLVARDNSSREQIFKAISTVLEFSNMEKETVYSKKGWKGVSNKNLNFSSSFST